MAEAASQSDQELSVYGKCHRHYAPTPQVLKQCALYFRRLVLDDPLFSLTRTRDKASQAMASHLGFTGGQLSRAELADACRYMKSLSPLVAGGFVRFIPASYWYEPPSVLHLRVPQDHFEHALPADLMDWFRQRVTVLPFKRDGNRWVHFPGEKLAPCRGIGIEFQNHPDEQLLMFFLHQSEITHFDESQGKVQFSMNTPDQPPDSELFDAWVRQSVNAAAYDLFTNVTSDVTRAARLGGFFLTESPLVSNLLQHALPDESSVEADVANGLMRLELPVLDGITYERIMDVRNAEQDAFGAFRTGLECKMKELRLIKDPNDLALRLRNVAHDLTRSEVADVKHRLARLQRRALADVALLSVGLLAAIQSCGWGALTAAYAVAHGYHTYSEYRNNVRESPGYFMWSITH